MQPSWNSFLGSEPRVAHGLNEHGLDEHGLDEHGLNEHGRRTVAARFGLPLLWRDGEAGTGFNPLPVVAGLPPHETFSFFSGGTRTSILEFALQIRFSRRSLSPRGSADSSQPTAGAPPAFNSGPRSINAPISGTNCLARPGAGGSPTASNSYRIRSKIQSKLYWTIRVLAVGCGFRVLNWRAGNGIYAGILR